MGFNFIIVLEKVIRKVNQQDPTNLVDKCKRIQQEGGDMKTKILLVECKNLIDRSKNS